MATELIKLLMLLVKNRGIVEQIDIEGEERPLLLNKPSMNEHKRVRAEVCLIEEESHAKILSPILFNSVTSEKNNTCGVS